MCEVSGPNIFNLSHIHLYDAPRLWNNFLANVVDPYTSVSWFSWLPYVSVVKGHVCSGIICFRNNDFFLNICTLDAAGRKRKLISLKSICSMFHNLSNAEQCVILLNLTPPLKIIVFKNYFLFLIIIN